MINRQHRFHGHGSLRFVYQKGASVRGQFVTLKYARNPRRKQYRLAVVVSRKVHKSAVVRNRIRRRIYETFRQYAGATTEPYDLVFTVYGEQVAEMESGALRDMITAQLKKAGVTPGEGPETPKAMV